MFSIIATFLEKQFTKSNAGCTLAVHWLHIISALTVTMCVNDPVRIYVILTIQRKAFSTCVCVRAFTHPLILECLHAHLYGGGGGEGRCRAAVCCRPVGPWDTCKHPLFHLSLRQLLKIFKTESSWGERKDGRGLGDIWDEKKLSFWSLLRKMVTGL